MVHLFINALAASAGGGLTYIRNVIPQLARADIKMSVAAGSGFRDEFRQHANLEFIELDVTPARRFWFEQSGLPNLIRRSGANVLL
ncbi:MAG: hypothetical protein WB992_18935, partial [Bryobacteraceae bacterium]